jgi:hypothetical protein
MCLAESPPEDEGGYDYDVYDSDDEDEDGGYYSNDLESRRQRAQAAFDAYLDDPLDDSPVIADGTDRRREIVMESFRA